MKSATISLVSSIFAACAFFLSWNAAFTCSFVQFSAIDNDTPLNIGFGLWGHSWYALSATLNNSFIFQFCLSYTGTPLDGPMKAARVFAIIALVLGGVFFFSSLIAGCRPSDKRMLTRSEGVGYLLACLCQGFALLLLNSNMCTNNSLIAALQADIAQSENVQIDFNDTCTLSTGARTCISAIVFWFLAALASCQATSAGQKEEQARKGNLNEPLVPNDIL